MQKFGWEIVLIILGVVAIINAGSPLINRINISQGPITALIVLGIIIYLLLQKYKV